MARLQSAMEYLMTYGWAILIIAVVLGALYQLGIFGSSATLQSSCLSDPGFLCGNPILNSSGYLAVKFGEIGLGTITITSIGCSANSTAPSSTLSMNSRIGNGGTTVLQFSCPLSKNAIGVDFKGYLWVTYNTQYQNGVIDRFAIVTARSSTNGNATNALGGIGSAIFAIPNYIYCVVSSSISSGTFYATANSQGIATWNSGTTNPLTTLEPACATYNGDIYCVGGYVNGVGYITSTYYAPIGTTGIGSWSATTPYPVATAYFNCATYNGYIYCVGGANGFSNKVYYATVGPTGIGSWTAGTTYPGSLAPGNCFAYNGYLYCENGVDTYYAPIVGPALGSWSAGESYPGGSGGYNGCAVNNGYIYCIGGTSYGGSSATYYAPLTSTGIGTWIAGTSYPVNTYFNQGPNGCVAGQGYMYCVGGTGSSTSYYAPVSSSGFGAWSATTTLGSQYTCQTG